MLYEKFVDCVKSWWTEYLTRMEEMRRAGRLKSRGASILFPNILLITHCGPYFIAELLGAVEAFEGLSIKQHRESSIARYFSQFDASQTQSLLNFEESLHSVGHLCIGREPDLEEVTRRFPQIELYESRLIGRGTHGCLLSFGEKFRSLAIENCLLINRYEQLYRCKNILAAFVFARNVSKREMIRLFQWTSSTEVVKGVHTVPGDKAKLIVAGQLQSVYLFPALRETTIGEFLNLHPEVVRQALKTENFVYEPYLRWCEHDGTCEDEAINPDMLVKRDDGFFDIYDLKTALLTKNSVTKGGRRRRRFIDYVEEGAAQLANYREYFSYRRNAEHAKDKYGIVVRDPRLVLVVGSYENVDVAEAAQACRRYGGIEVIDYDTFCHFFIGAG